MTLNITAPADPPTAPASYGDAVAYDFAATSLGQVLVAATEKGICAILIGSDRERLTAGLKQSFPAARAGALPEAWVGDVVALIETPAGAPDLPLDLRGSDLEIKVWQALRAIPAGTTLSYSALAERIGLKNGARDVSEACAANRIAVAVPCHRILRKDGSISGYRWGVHRKRELLKREGAR